MKEDTTNLKEQIRNKSMEPIVPADMQKESHYYSGITQLEYFAAMAMQGLISHYGAKYDMTLASESFNIAEGMLKESIKRRK